MRFFKSKLASLFCDVIFYFSPVWDVQWGRRGGGRTVGKRGGGADHIVHPVHTDLPLDHPLALQHRLPSPTDNK